MVECFSFNSSGRVKRVESGTGVDRNCFVRPLVASSDNPRILENTCH